MSAKSLQPVLTCFLGLVLSTNTPQAWGGIFGPDIDPKGLTGIQHIAVQSRLGDTFHASWVGLTVFTNKFFSAPVPEWQTDAFVQNTVKEEMKGAATPRDVQPLDTSGMDLAAFYTKSGAITFSKEVVATMLTQARKQGADALVVVEMAPAMDHFQPPGFGAYTHVGQHCIYTSFMLTVFRADSGKRAAVAHESSPCESLNDTFPVKDSWDQYTVEEKAAFEAATKQRIRDHLSYQLRSAHLRD